MFVFILLSLAISYVVNAKISLTLLLASDLPIYLGIGCMIAALLLAWFKKVSCHIWYDLYASGSLLVWLPYWHPDFREGSPVFFFLPLYFAMICAFFFLAFVRKRDQIDDDTIEYLQWLSDSGRFNPYIIAAFVALGLFLKQHFLIYPVAVTLFVMRYALASSLRE